MGLRLAQLCLILCVGYGVHILVIAWRFQRVPVIFEELAPFLPDYVTYSEHPVIFVAIIILLVPGLFLLALLLISHFWAEHIQARGLKAIRPPEITPRVRHRDER